MNEKFKVQATGIENLALSRFYFHFVFNTDCVDSRQLILEQLLLIGTYGQNERRVKLA